MANPRADILRGFQAAERFHRELDIRNHYLSPAGRIDVFRVAADIDVPVMFQALDGLLGAYLPDPAPGILITTKRPKSVQRFTCAHELGHFWLKHEESFDDESMIGFAYSQFPGAASIEWQADAFAFSFLMPRWLVRDNLERLMAIGLTLPMPAAVYQLSLRLGCSYSATVMTLERYQLVNAVDAKQLKDTKPREIKKSLVGDITVDDWHRDVWVIAEGDDKITVDAGVEDLFITQVHEPSTAGYVTSTQEAVAAGFTVLREQIVSSAADHNSNEPGASVLGSFPLHKTIFATGSPGFKNLKLKQQRPWESTDNARAVLDFLVDIREPVLGLSPEEKHLSLQKMLND